MTIQAISTRYAGCLFRSRLEARWAVFFDTLNISWVYEPEGYEISIDGWGDEPPVHKSWYLPDFWLPREELWVEVKGQFSPGDLEKLCFASFDDRGGLPIDPTGTLATDEVRNRARILLLSNIPRVLPGMQPIHFQLMFYKGEILGEYVDWDEAGDLRKPYGFDQLMSDGDYRLTLDPTYIERLNGDGQTARTCPSNVANAYAAARSARFEHDNRKVW